MKKYLKFVSIFLILFVLIISFPSAKSSAVNKIQGKSVHKDIKIYPFTPRLIPYVSKISASTHHNYYKSGKKYISKFRDIEIHVTGIPLYSVKAYATVYSAKGKKIATTKRYVPYRKSMIDAVGVQMVALKNTQALKIPKGGKVVVTAYFSVNQSKYYNAVSKKYTFTNKF